MNVDHFGICVTFVVVGVALAIAGTVGLEINIFPESSNAQSFLEYCKQLNIKC